MKPTKKIKPIKQIKLFFVLILFAILVVLVMFSPSWAATYYVDATNGSDQNDGLSQPTAWKTIEKVNSSTFKSGDEILFKRGETWRENHNRTRQLIVPSSGSEGNPILFSAYSIGDNPVFNAAIELASWTSEALSNCIAYYTTLADEPNQVFVDGERLIVETVKENLDKGEWYWDSGGTRVYLRTTDDANPSKHIIEASAFNFNIGINNRDYIIIENFTLKNGNIAGIIVEGASEKIIVQNTDVSYGYWENIWVRDSSFNCVIQNNTSSFAGGNGIKSNKTRNLIIRGNIVHNNCQLDIDSLWHNWTSGIKSNDMETAGLLIENNIVYGGGRDIQGNDVVSGFRGQGIHLDFSGQNSTHVIRYNKVYSNREKGIMVEYGTWNVNVYYNIVYDNGYHGIALYNTISNCKIFNNVSYNNATYGITIYGKGEPNEMNNNIIKNNICIGNSIAQLRAGYGGENDGTKGSGNVYTFNCFGVESSNFIEWGHNNFYDTYNAWEAAYQNSNSVNADPLFNDAVNGDFSLKRESPVINAGTDVGLTRDFVGNGLFGGAWDIGAFEWQQLELVAPINFRVVSSF